MTCPDAELIEMLRAIFGGREEEWRLAIRHPKMGFTVRHEQFRRILSWSNARRDSAVADRDAIIQELHWMARRYCDGRMSYVSATFNALTRTLLRWGLKLQEPFFARDGMGRRYDYLSNEEAAAAEADMPKGHAILQEEWQARATQLVADRDATIARLQEALKRIAMETPGSTGSFSAYSMANWMHEVADNALAETGNQALAENERQEGSGDV